MLRIENLQVRYGHIDAVKGLSLEVREGEMVTVIGANGAGKSSTLMAVSGLVPVVGGTITFNGERIDRLPAETIVARGIVHVPEGRRVFPRLTVRENLGLGAYSRPYNKKEYTADLQYVLDLFPLLAARQAQLAGTLSGGEQQMLAIARGLMAHPKLLLLDEPSLGLAPKLVTQLFQILADIHRAGITVLLVEQNAYQALRLVHRGYVLETGQLVLAGPASTLLNDPSVKAAYLGS